MVEYYVEPAGNDGNLGTTPGAGNAWLTVKYALETAGVPGLAAGDNVWIRRTINEIPAGPADISPAFDGSAGSPISVIGWPRDEATGTATFTNGSSSVTAVSIAGDREKHQGRRIKCDADAKWYLITRVVDANTFTIDREYAGTTAAAANFTIQKDDDFDTRPAAARAVWDGDADDVPIIDFNGAAFNITMSTDLYHVFKNMEFKDSLDGNGIIFSLYGECVSFIGCLIKTNQDKHCLKTNSTFCYLERVIMEGSGVGPSQRAFAGKRFYLKDCAIYNMGDYGIEHESMNLYMENVNIGVEQANGDDDIHIQKGSIAFGRDVKLGGTNGYIAMPTYLKKTFCQIENYGKILGAHKTWFSGGTYEKVTAGSGAPIPNQRGGGSTHLIEITPNVANYEYIEDWGVEVFSHEFEVDTTTRTWRYYIQTNIVGGLTATNLWITVEYIKDYDDTSEYVIITTKSDEAVAARADINDWTQYIEVPSVTPAVASKVRIKCCVSKHDGANKIWIDPKVVNP